MSWLTDWIPLIGDDEEEISPEEQFINHYKKTGTLLTNDRGNPTLKFQDILPLFKNRMDKQKLNFLYENHNPALYRKKK